ncbi:MAG: transcriptional regulator [Desulfobulbaceae bacterium A2]|nr:MAG: transcriptional regulator [Desulfobulbaceae bacterium A2]
MGDHLAFERYTWFDAEIRAGRYPNAIRLAEQFEISERTAKRNITFMRDMLGAPLEYLRDKRGYIYSDTSFSLPALHFSQEEVLAVLLARNLLTCCAGGIISDAIGRIGKKLLSETKSMGLSEELLDRLFSASWNGYSPAQADTFQIAAQSLLESRLLRFSYHSPLDAQTSDRIVEPHHLQHYMGTWILLAWCRQRQDWRKFILSRMSAPALSGDQFPPRPVAEWWHHLSGAYGIFQGNDHVHVKLLFCPARARWVRGQLWHPDQHMEAWPDGSLLLSLPAADFRELKLRILQYGAEVEVLEPQTLREEIRREALAINALYTKSTSS